ncbi:hypothetical protein [Mycolicibacterium fortuitum]|uniref:hypothetical protein n=1 Tax=Mycolicibacterium fortuitum TaxID=1766 RepID=UPI0026067294|nr:hypothetical protein [Mycolicibacterium fortuitum]
MNAPHDTTLSVSPIDAFRDAHGFFTMVAVDQRESLRHMLSVGRATATVEDDELMTFKAAVIDAVSTTASGVLLDREFGLAAAQHFPGSVILAADILSASRPGGPMDVAALDDEVTAETIEEFGAKALKLLLPWHPARRSQAIDLAHTFMARCGQLGLPGVVEGVVRPRDETTESPEAFAEALVAAAAHLAPTHPDLYKTEVIYRDHHDRALATATAAAITELLSCPWVVLSSGVAGELFPAAAAAAVAGGASGFLAGRAVWSDATKASDPAAHLQAHAAQNLQRISDHVRGLHA